MIAWVLQEFTIKDYLIQDPNFTEYVGAIPGY
jgi:hypothetical protein